MTTVETSADSPASSQGSAPTPAPAEGSASTAGAGSPGPSGQHHTEVDAITPLRAHSSTEELSTEAWVMFYLVGGVAALVGWLFKVATGGENPAADIPLALGALMLSVPMIVETWREIKTRNLGASTLATTAILAAFAISRFEIAALLAFVLQIADQFLRRTAAGAKNAIKDLVALTPDIARVIIQGASGPEERELHVAEVQVGQVVRVRPGENLPVDGRVVAGRTTINQASLTGEAVPVEAEAGTDVYAGTENLTGQIDLEVTGVGQETTIGKVTQLIAAAQSAKSPRQMLIEQVARFYTPIALSVAAVVFFFTSQQPLDGAVEEAALRAVTVLVVLCPTALLLSHPTAMVAAFASAARLGILVKDAKFMDAAAGVNAVVLDKTGTITTGRFGVSRLAPAEGVEGAELLRAAANGEQHSNHPLAQSILTTARAARIEPDGTQDFEEIHGRGVRARTSIGELAVGRATWLRELAPHLGEQIGTVEQRIEGMSGVHVLQFGEHGPRYLGAVGLEDKVRADAKGVIDRLREIGVRMIGVFTGDRLSVAKRVGVTVGADAVEAECLPEEKHEQVRALGREGYRVMFVGDGINDGPALAEAEVGVAMGLSGSDIATNSAGIALMTDELNRLPFLMELSRRARAVITQNIIVSIVVALIGLVLAATGQFVVIGELGIAAATLFNFGPDIIVLGNSFRLFRFGEDFLAEEHAAREEAASRGQRREASIRGLHAVAAARP